MLEGDTTLSHATLPFFGTGNGGGQAEQDVDAPGDVALGLLEVHASAEKRPHRRANQGIEAIGAACQQRKADPKHQQLLHDRSTGRINKLR
jgi:hypothetical protein